MMRELLTTVARSASSWIELRYHARKTKQIAMRNGRLEESSSVQLTGLGVRVLVDGVFGFASTTNLSREGIRSAVADAQQAARSATASKRQRVEALAPIPPTTGTFGTTIEDSLDDHPLEEKLDLVQRIEERIRNADDRIVSSMARYAEIQDEKIIVTSDNVAVSLKESRPDFRAVATAQENGEQTLGMDSHAVTGGWADLFSKRAPEEMADYAVRMAVDQLSAPHPKGGEAIVVLDPQLVGVLCHEAIGHTVEADIVLGGAITQGKIGQKVSSELVTMCDSGHSEYHPHAVGTLNVDDEGVKTQRTVLIERGVLRSYLHNRETAAHFGVEPTGNSRAWEYNNEPIIRMRNTYIEPGETSLEEMMSTIEHGYYLKGLGLGGQADSNAEFMFGVAEAWEIASGRKGRFLRGVTISGNAFDALESVDAIGDTFEWSYLGGACGKGQPAKVDAGGPHVRCRVTIGGRQE
jgi:TldD protein